MQASRITVIGAGPGGLAMAAHLAMRGYPTTIFNADFRGRKIINLFDCELVVFCVKTTIRTLERLIIFLARWLHFRILCTRTD